MANYSSTFFPKSGRPTRPGPGYDSRQLRLDFEQVATPAVAADANTSLDAPARFATQFAVAPGADEFTRFNNVAINQLARQLFGAAAGHSREAYDSAEAGFNLYLARRGLIDSTADDTIRWLKSQDDRLPLQNKRDYQQVELQQFSTPHAEAYLVVWVATLRAGMRVLEPSAGTGNIAVLARLAGAQVDTNEIDPRRRGLLQLQGFEPTEVDAERLDNLLPPGQTYDAIVMNPPFSATGGRVRGHDGAFGARHVERALLRLKPGGRLVAIVGPDCPSTARSPTNSGVRSKKDTVCGRTSAWMVASTAGLARPTSIKSS